jgi:hypothetical protein
MPVGPRSPTCGPENFFFKVRNRLRVLLGVPRPGADMRKAKLLENTSEGHLGQINRKARTENPLEIDAAPARKPILLRIGASLHKASQFFHLLC